ncbi:MAG: hypothetical protein WC765_07170 [Phycisphaerae bacterium]|jgi:hypothetical protein
MENDYIPNPNRYFAIALMGSVILGVMSPWMGKTAELNRAVWTFFWFCYGTAFIGYVVDSARVWTDGHARVYEAQASMAEMLGRLDDERMNALAKIDLTITLEKHRREWIQKYEGVQIEYWLYVWERSDESQICPERNCPDGRSADGLYYRDGRNALVKLLQTRGWVSKNAPVGNKSELWTNSGYAIFKGIIESYKYTFERVRELEGDE